MADTLYILLPVHNRIELTRRFIKCLAAQTYRSYHLILLDDGSSDGTAEMVRERIRPLTVITGNGNWWWAGALQEGYRWLRARRPTTDLVLIINDDTEFEIDFLERAVAFLRDRSKTFLLAQAYAREDGILVDAGTHVDWRRFTFERASESRPVNCLSTRGLFFRVGDFVSVGGFRPRLLPHYLSDYEFTIRARRRGMLLATDPSVRLRTDPAATGWHDVSGGSLAGSLKKVFSVKSAINPLALSIFVALACPWRWKAACWIRIAARSASRGWSLLRGRIPVR